MRVWALPMAGACTSLFPLLCGLPPIHPQLCGRNITCAYQNRRYLAFRSIGWPSSLSHLCAAPVTSAVGTLTRVKTTTVSHCCDTAGSGELSFAGFLAPSRGVVDAVGRHIHFLVWDCHRGRMARTFFSFESPPPSLPTDHLHPALDCLGPSLPSPAPRTTTPVTSISCPRQWYTLS